MPFNFIPPDDLFPTTNFNEINLDWILALATQLKETAESGGFDGAPGEPGTATNGIAYFTTADTFADIQAAIANGELPVLMYYNMGTPCFLYCYDHSNSSIKFCGLSNTEQIQLTWYSNNNRSQTTRTLVSNQSPQFYGNPTAPTQAATDSSTRIANTQFVNTAVNTAINAALEEYTVAALSDNIKQALLQLAQKVAYIDANGATYYQALYDALYPPINVDYIEATFNQGVNVVYDTDTLDSLKSYLTVVAYYDDSTSETLASDAYVLSGTLTAGTSTITVTYAGASDTFTVTVTSNVVTSITAVFTQGSNIVYENDSLDDLKQYLTVTANYTNGATTVLNSNAYTLSGTLTVGTSVITVTYQTFTDTFNVTVTAYWTWKYDPSVDGLLTAQSYCYVGTMGTKTEEITDGLLHIVVPQSSTTNDGYQVRLNDGNGNYNISTGVIEIKVKFMGLADTDIGSTNGFRAQLSQGGTRSAKIFAHKQSGVYEICRRTGSDTSAVLTTITTDTWYTVRITVNSNSFDVSLNDSVIYTGSGFATTVSTYNGLYVIAPGNSTTENTNLYIEHIYFKTGV